MDADERSRIVRIDRDRINTRCNRIKINYHEDTKEETWVFPMTDVKKEKT